ncbi:MAG: polysaccharide deacetylase [Caulobacter sp.]|nr:polysaccharide deacetylase [Caulobacter sp.]
MQIDLVYHPDRTLKGKIRRRLVRLAHRRAAVVNLPRPLISFSFDDAPASAATIGAQLLEAHGHRGTYYISAALAGHDGPMGRYANAEQIAALAQAGHEIACHTYSHLDCGQANGAQADEDAALNDEVLRAWGAPSATSFAYPYGDVSAAAKQALAHRFTTLRALHHGLIETGSDLNQAPAIGIEGPDGEGAALRWMMRAAAKKAWLILYTHDVAESPSEWGCTPVALERLIAAADRLGFDVATVADAAARIGAPETARQSARAAA